MFLHQHKYCTDTIEQFQKPFFIIIEFDLSDNDLHFYLFISEGSNLDQKIWNKDVQVKTILARSHRWKRRGWRIELMQKSSFLNLISPI
jgi:hypothetical protein